MTEFLNECFMTVNLPVTVMLLMVLGYWLLVIVGLVGLDALDMDLDADVDLDGDIDTDISGDGFFGNALEFLYVGDVPVVIIGSFFVVFMWIGTVTCNHYLNASQSFWWMLLLLIPNMIISLLLTKVALMPFGAAFKNYDRVDSDRDRNEMIGVIGIVKTLEVSDEFGQLEIERKGPPLVINVRTKRGTRLAQGDAAKIVSFNNMNDTFVVELSKWEKE